MRRLAAPVPPARTAARWHTPCDAVREQEARVAVGDPSDDRSRGGSSRWVQLVRERARLDPGAPAYTFLRHGRPVDALSFAELDRRARAIAAAIRREVSHGERALLLYSPGLEFAPAFFGCLYAGVAAVPAPPPMPDRSLAEVVRLANEAGVALILSSGAMPAELAHALATTPSLRGVARIATDEVADAEADTWRDGEGAESDLAVVTATPFVVGRPGLLRLSHAEVFDRVASIAERLGDTRGVRSLVWIPPYVDMGLVAGVLLPVYGGMHSGLMSPLEFFRRPLSWLEAMASFRARISGGPEFAYALCRTALELHGLRGDLSEWTDALIDARARETTREAFARALEPYGFRADAFVDWGGASEEDSSWFGCHGEPTMRELAVVDPVTAREVERGVSGEIWLRTLSLGEGYWEGRRRPARTWPAYRGDTGEGPFLATGEEGALVGSDLVMRGRAGETIRVADGSVEPGALERFLKGSHGSLATEAVVAFGVDGGVAERLVVAVELAADAAGEDGTRDDLHGGAATIRERVEEFCGAIPEAVVLLLPGALGDLRDPTERRDRCRSRYRDGTLATLATLSASDGTSAS